MLTNESLLNVAAGDEPGTVENKTPPDASTETNPGAGADSGEVETFDPSLADYVDNGLLLGKYKSTKAALEGYRELSTKLRERAPEPPESPDGYEFKFEEGVVAADYDIKSDPLWKEMAPVFHKGRVPNDVAQEVMDAWVRWKKSTTPDPKVEFQKLGGEAKAILETVQGFSAKNLDDGEKALLENLGTTAEGVRLIHKLVQMTHDRVLPKTAASADAGKTSQVLTDEAFAYKDKHKSTFMHNEEQQATYRAMMAKAIAAEEREEKAKKPTI